jgi:hypothetical protein
MDKKLAGLIGAMAGVAALSSAGALNSAQAAANPSEALQAGSYADLLAPIGNASALLKAADAAQTPEVAGGAQLAQYYYYGRSPYYHHHHHHHHHHRRGVYFGPGGFWVR